MIYLEKTVSVLLGQRSNARILSILTMALEVKGTQLCTAPLQHSPVVIPGDHDRLLHFPYLLHVLSPEPTLSPCPVTRFWLLHPLITPMVEATSVVPSWFLGSHSPCFIFSCVVTSAASDKRDLCSQPLTFRNSLFPCWSAQVLFLLEREHLDIFHSDCGKHWYCSSKRIN